MAVRTVGVFDGRQCDLFFSLTLVSCCCGQSAPYLDIRKEPGLIGNAKFEGYCVDLAEKICKEYLHVDYEIRLVTDGKYGEKLANGTWNGMVGELTNHVRSVSLFFIFISNKHVREIYYFIAFL